MVTTTPNSRALNVEVYLRLTFFICAVVAGMASVAGIAYGLYEGADPSILIITCLALVAAGRLLKLASARWSGAPRASSGY